MRSGMQSRPIERVNTSSVFRAQQFRCSTSISDEGESDLKTEKSATEEAGKKRNSQTDHHGKGHRPEEFDVMNPQKQVPKEKGEADD